MQEVEVPSGVIYSLPDSVNVRNHLCEIYRKDFRGCGREHWQEAGSAEFFCETDCVGKKRQFANSIKINCTFNYTFVP